MKLLIATGLYPPEIGGPATYTVLVERELSRRGIEVAVLPFRSVRSWPPGIRHLLYFVKCFWGALKSDVVYAQDPVSVGLPAMLAAKITFRPFIIRIAGDYAWEQSAQRFGVKDSIDEFQQINANYAKGYANVAKKFPWQARLFAVVQRWVTNQAKLIVTPSKYFQKLVSGWVKKPEKVITIYNGIQLESSKSKIQNPKFTTKTIVSAGRLVPWKGFDLLIELMPDLPDWQLVIVGDGPEYEQLNVKCQKLNVANRVKFTGAISRGELLDYLSEASIFALNTSFESFSFQIVEAMNAGVPVVATKIGNLEEIMENGKDGLLVQPNNKMEFLAAIKKIDQDENFRKHIVENAKKKAREFSIEKTVNKLMAVIKSL